MVVEGLGSQPDVAGGLLDMSPQTTALLARQLVKRDACAGTVVTGAYDLPLHVGALFIIFGVSGMACAIPLIVTRFPIPKFFFTVRHFGTGVLLATAFVHLLPTAFISLGNPCLPKFWTQDYNSMPGAIALAGVLVVTVIEMILSPARQFIPKPQRRRLASTAGAGREAGDDDEENENALSLVNMSSRAPSPETPSSAVEKLPLDIEPLTPEQQRKKSMLQCVMLEIGILFHSIFIGMALSVSTGGDFVVLLIAISFHQMFEGLALGSRIASIEWPAKSLRPWFMVLAYGCTTPIGQAIGIGTHTLYSPDSVFGLVLVGTMNAISAGLLIFASLIELVAEDFLSDHSWATLRGKKRVAACILVLLGAISMSLVGAWA